MEETKPKRTRKTSAKKVETTERKSMPALSPESKENRLIHLATNLAEKQLMDGTAAPSVINHFLKLATSRERLEQEILEKQAKLIEAKASSIAEGKDAEKLAKQAIEAMKNYSSSSQ